MYPVSYTAYGRLALQPMHASQVLHSQSVSQGSGPSEPLRATPRQVVCTRWSVRPDSSWCPHPPPHVSPTSSHSPCVSQGVRAGLGWRGVRRLLPPPHVLHVLQLQPLPEVCSPCALFLGLLLLLLPPSSGLPGQ